MTDYDYVQRCLRDARLPATPEETNGFVQALPMLRSLCDALYSPSDFDGADAGMTFAAASRIDDWTAAGSSA